MAEGGGGEERPIKEKSMRENTKLSKRKGKQVRVSFTFLHPLIQEGVAAEKQMRAHHKTPPHDQVSVIKSSIKTMPKGGRSE